MTLILSGTSGLSDVDGSAATPAIRGTDANTGIFFPAADTIAFAEGGAEIARFDSSGNLGIGTSSPTVKLDVRGNVLKIYDSGSATANLTVRNSTTGDAAGFTLQQDGVNTLFYNNSNGASVFATNGTERARIDSSGNLLVGQTGTGLQNSNSWDFNRNGQAYCNHISGTGNGTAYFLFALNASTIGSITQSGTTAVLYNTTSDYRLKENVQPLSGALARVASLKPCTYTWKSAPEETGEGFIAHELAEVCPQAVSGEKDAVNEDGSIKPQGIDTSFLVATLTAAIQELKALVDTQASTITQLQADVAALKAQP